MDELKQRLTQAQPADVKRLLSPGSLAFQPREAAFTALVTQCARSKAGRRPWQCLMPCGRPRG